MSLACGLMDWKVEVERLVATKVEESRVLEFERQLDLVLHSDKIEVLKDLTGMANGADDQSDRRQVFCRTERALSRRTERAIRVPRTAHRDGVRRFPPHPITLASDRPLLAGSEANSARS